MSNFLCVYFEEKHWIILVFSFFLYLFCLGCYCQCLLMPTSWHLFHQQYDTQRVCQENNHVQLRKLGSRIGLCMTFPSFPLFFSFWVSVFQKAENNHEYQKIWTTLLITYSHYSCKSNIKFLQFFVYMQFGWLFNATKSILFSSHCNDNTPDVQTDEVKIRNSFFSSYCSLALGLICFLHHSSGKQVTMGHVLVVQVQSHQHG